MSFHYPLALVALLAVPAAVALFVYAARRRARARAVFGARAGGGAAPRRRRYKAALVVTALALAVVAWAGPRYGTQLRESEEERIDLVIALDVSRSMQAQDVAPSRLERAKYQIGRLLEELPGDRIGLVVFAGDAFVQAPLTTDHSALRLFLDIAGPDLVPTPGTDFSTAVRAARIAFDARGRDDEPTSEPAAPRALLVVSDGEDHQSGVEEAVEAARADGIRVFAAGVGTEEGGPIPIYRGDRLTGYHTDRSGQTVTTQLQARSLRALAEGGRYVRLDRPGGLDELAAALKRLDRVTLSAEAFEAFAERYQWPLALAVLLLILEALVPLAPGPRTPEATADERPPTAA